MNINRALPDNISICSNDSQQTIQSIQSIQSCRICMEPVNDLKDLKQFCLCSGYVSVVHKSCLLKWITISNVSKCEICSKEFKLIKGTKRYWKNILIAIFVILFIIGIYIYIYMYRQENNEVYIISVVTTLTLISLAINNSPNIFYTKLLDIEEYYDHITDHRDTIENDHTQLPMYNTDNRDIVLPEITELTELTETTQLIHVNR